MFDLLACPDRDALLGRVAVEDVWGIGPNHARLLKQHGITTALQLRGVDDQWIRKRMGIVGLRLVMELRGVSCLDLEQCPAPKQSLTCSRAFGKLISTLAEMEEAVSVYTSRVAEKLRRERLAATVLTVCLTTNEFKEGPQYSNALTLKLPIVTDSTADLIGSALQGIRAIYRDGYHYKKAGVMLTGLVPASQTQADLFDDQDRGKVASGSCPRSMPSMIGGEQAPSTMRQAVSPRPGRRSFIDAHRPTRPIGMRFPS